VDGELRQVVPNLALRVEAGRTPDALLRAAVLTACSDGKPHFVNHRMLVEDLGPAYGIAGCHTSLPIGGGAHTAVRLNLAESVRRARGGARAYLGETLPRDVALAAELMAARVRYLVEQSGFYEHDWLVREGLISRDRFSALFGVFGVAEAVDELLARDGVTGPGGIPARYGRDQAAADVAHALVARVASLVGATPMPYCEATGGHALLHAHAGTDSDVDVTAGAQVPPGHQPALYEHIRVVAPNHRYFPAGVSDVFRFEPAVGQNPDAVLAVMRGAFAEGMRDFTFDVTGNGFTRVTGFQVRDRDIAALLEAAAVRVAAIRQAPQDRRDAVRSAAAGSAAGAPVREAAGRDG
jgi:YjjI family glycine radical enzyme